MADALDTIENEAQAHKCRNYSLLKLGNPVSISRAATRLSKRVPKFSSTIHAEPASYAIAYPGTGLFEAPNSAEYVALKLGTILKLPTENVIGLVKSDLSGTPYHAATANERYQVRDTTLPKSRWATLKDKRAILLDDCIAGGASLAKSRVALAPHLSALTCHVLLDLRRADDPARMEEIVNTVAIEPDAISGLADMWNAKSHCTTSKLLTYTFRQKLNKITNRLTAVGAVNLYLSSFLFLHAEPKEIEDDDRGLRELAENLRSKHGLQIAVPNTVSKAISKGNIVQEGRRAVFLDWLKTRLGKHPGYRLRNTSNVIKFLSDFREMLTRLSDVPFA